MLAQVVVEAALVVLVARLLLRSRAAQAAQPEAMAPAMAATENLLRRLDEKRRSLETAIESVAEKGEAAPRRAPAPAPAVESTLRRASLDQAVRLAARGMTSAEIARELGVPRAEVEMYLSLREGSREA
jgi:DNA-binding NarL/FixJ family response regulator